MRVAIMQPYFLPYIGYFQLIGAVDTFVVYDDVNFIKKGWINRNNILVNGKGHLFSIPLRGVSQNKRINETEINQESEWQQDLLKTITLSYKKAPCFAEVFSLIESIVLFGEKNLATFITYSLKAICQYLEIETNIILSSEIKKDDHLKGQDKILEIAKSLHADTYINAIGGVELYNKETFSKNGIVLKFLDTNTITYNQKTEGFVPFLSIMDVMMFNDVETIRKMMAQYKLV